MTTERSDSQAYLDKKKLFDGMLTVYGRKPVLEALQDKSTQIHRLHLADSNKSAAIMDNIIALAKNKGAEILYHNRQALSRISKNSSQDQGVAADLICRGFQTYDNFLQTSAGQKFTLLALDGISNPQNLGMIIRSACAGNIDGILLPQYGSAQIDPLVIKASAGTVFRAPILRCNSLAAALKDFKTQGTIICALSSHAKIELKEFFPAQACIYVLGNETDGVSKEVAQLCNEKVRIAMNNGVESLNVAVTAALIAFR
ncbi:MAG: RNA methyltransferase [Pseudomonadota bacterium]